MKMNCRIKLKDNVMIIAGEKICFDKIEIAINPTEQMILNHHVNYDLKEISLILREFYQMDSAQADKVIEEFVTKLQDNEMGDIIYNTVRFEVDSNMCFVKNNKVELIEDDDGTGILRDFSKGKMLFINKSGIEMWKYIERTCSIQDMIDHFVEFYNVKREELETDIEAFIKSLLEKDFIINVESMSNEVLGCTRSE